MNNERPQTLDQWRSYIGTLSGEALRSKAIAANSLRFARMLLNEGFSASDVTEIYRMFARQFVATGQEPTGGDYIDYRSLANE